MWVERILARTPALLVLSLFLHLSSMLPLQELCAQTRPVQEPGTPTASRDHQKIAATSVNVPLFFEANEGQTDQRVKFLTHSSDYTMFLTSTETVLAESKAQVREKGIDNLASAINRKASTAAVIHMELVGANRAPEVAGLGELPGKVNYLIGNDARSWHTGVSLYSQVRAEQVYPGINLLFHGDQKQLEYDFVVSPGADPSRIAFRVRGATRIELDRQGDLILHTADSAFRMHKPVIYQAAGSERRLIEGGFVRKGKHEVVFRLGAYDRNQTLVIDPAIGYSTFLGGSGDDQPFDLAVDPSNAAAPKLYVTGFTSNITTFPEASNPLVGNSGGKVYGFVAKIDPTITNDPGGAASLDYLTFVGGGTPFSGNSCQSAFAKISLDTSQGPSSIQPVVSGLTNCSNYPGTQIQPITGGFASVATRLTVSGTAIDASVVLGGNGTTNGAFSSVDSSGNVLISGATSTTDLPTTTGAYLTTFNNGGAGTYDCFVAKLPRSGLTPPSYLTYLNTGGGSTTGSQVGCGAIEDSTGKLDAGGNTVSATAFHVGAGGANLANGFQTTFQGTQDTFGMRLDPTQSGTAELLYASYYGGGGVTNATSGALDLGNGVVAIGGYTTSNGGTNAPNIPLQNAFQSANLAAASGGETGFLVVVNTQQTGAASLLCSTYFGGSSGSDEVHAVTYDAGDPTAFRIILGGQTRSGTDFPTQNALQAFQGVQDGFVSSLKVPLPTQTFTASLYFSSYVGGGVQSSGESERVTGVAVDTNHTIYATGRTISADFFSNLTTPTIVNGFQTTCTSCGGNPPLDDVVVFSILTTPGATLQSISITPASATITVGQTQQFDAQGFFSDGTIQDITTAAAWSSSNTSVATMSTTTQGLATTAGLMAGSTSISASLSGINSSNSPILTVNAATGNFTLTVTAGNGSTGTGLVSDSTGVVNCQVSNTTATGACSESFPSGTVETLSATATSQGATFIGWSGACTGTGNCVVTMNQNQSVIATFAAPTIVANFDVNGEGDNDKQRIDGASPPLQILLTNISTTRTVNFSGVTPSAGYTATTDCTTLTPGQSCHVFASFTATTSCQAVPGTITVADDAPEGAINIAIDGFGADTGLQVSDLTNSNLTAQALAQSLVGPGVQISNVTYTGALRAAGNFTSSSNIIGFSQGIVLSTGSVRNVVGPNCSTGISVDNGEPGDADLNTIVGTGNTTNDAAVLEFDFIPTSSVISFQYVFASDEYNEFVFQFNDVFGFFLTDKSTGAKTNIALIPGTNLPVSINNVNDGNPLGTNPVNPQFYINNDFQFPTAAPVDTEMDGLTVVFTAQAQVVPNNAYHIKLAIADANDFALDSNVFVQAGSLTSSTLTLTPGTLGFGNQQVGTTSASQAIMVTNVGSQTVTISSIIASTNFTQTNNCPATLSAVGTSGSSCTANVSFAPGTSGSLTGSLTVTYTTPSSDTPQTQTASLTGTGTGTGFALTVTEAGTGTGTVTSNPTGINCPTTCSANFASGAQVTLTASAAEGSTFAGWSGGGCTGTGTCVVTLTAATTVTATFNTTSNNFALTVAEAGTGTGAVTSNPAGINCPTTCSANFASGTQVTLTASAAEGSTFTGWSGGGCTGTGTCVVTVTAATAVTATFNSGNSPITIAIGQGSSSTVTTTPGSNAVFGLVLTALPGTTGTVQLTCSSPITSITCNIVPSSVTLTGKAINVAIVVETFCKGSVPNFEVPGGFGNGLGILLATLALCGAVWTYKKQPRWALSFGLLIIFAVGMSACSNLAKSPSGTATPPGSYPLVVTATAPNGATSSVNLTLVVKP